VCPVLPVSLACPFMMDKTQDKYTLEITEVAIMNGQARDTGNTGHTRHRTDTRLR
jgi:hypothetical protein